MRFAAAIGVALVVATITVFLVPASTTVSLSTSQLPANGTASVSVVAQAQSLLGTHAPFSSNDVTLMVTEGNELVRFGPMQREGGRWRRDLIVRHSPGKVQLHILVGDERIEKSVELLPDRDDWDEDGFPNAVELTGVDERQSFRSWFVAIAQAQVLNIDPDWHLVHRDCAGLLRYAYKEALKKHDAKWWSRRKNIEPPVSQDIVRYNYPDLPIIGTNIFRTGEVETPFGPAANARALRDENTVFLSHTPDGARSGDLLFYERRGESGHVMHAMIFVAADPDHDDPNDDGPEGPWVVYHTGPDGFGVNTPDGSGEVRLVRLADLNAHPDSIWHAKRSNPSFLGFYRWRLLS